MAQKHKFDYDLIVIGSGAAGSTAALAATKKGKKVALIDGDVFGGESANWRDVPSMALLEATNLFTSARHGSRFGLRSATLGYNYPAILAWRDKAIKRGGSADNRKFYESAGITTYASNAYFLTPHEISVNRTHLTADKFVIATGTHFASPDTYGIETVKYHTLRTIFDTKRIPRNLFIVGSGPEAIEYANIFAALGSKVYISEKAVHILPDFDQEVGALLADYLHEALGVNILTQTQVSEVAPKGVGTNITYTRGAVSRNVQVDSVLYSENRTPTVDLGLENAAVEYTMAGISVDDHLRTSARHIYAAGSVTSPNVGTQVAMLQGRSAAFNLYSKSPSNPDQSLIPRLIHTNPGVASVGLSGIDCLKRDLAINSAVVPLSQIPRSNTSDFTKGFVKLIADKKGQLLGGTIVAPHASEMIQEITLALAQNLSAAEIARLPHGFLSWSEAIRAAASKLA